MYTVNSHVKAGIEITAESRCPAATNKSSTIKELFISQNTQETTVQSATNFSIILQYYTVCAEDIRSILNCNSASQILYILFSYIRKSTFRT